MKKVITTIAIIGLFLAMCGTASADDFSDNANLENIIGAGFITGLKVWEFGDEWGLSPRLGGQLMIPRYDVFIAPIFSFGALLLKPGDTVEKRAKHFSFDFLLGMYLITEKRFDFGIQFGPGYLSQEIITEGGQVVRREMSGTNFSYGFMVRLGDYTHLNLSVSTSSIGEGVEFKPVQAYGLGFGMGWFAS